MSRTDTAVRVIGASPDRVFAALTDSDALAVWPPPDEMTGRFEHFDARPGRSHRLVLAYALAGHPLTQGKVATPKQSEPEEPGPDASGDDPECHAGRVGSAGAGDGGTVAKPTNAEPRWLRGRLAKLRAKVIVRRRFPSYLNRKTFAMSLLDTIAAPVEGSQNDVLARAHAYAWR